MTHVSSTAHRADVRRRKVLACVDKVLSRLGPDVRRAITFYMRREHSLKHYEIPDKPHQFHLALQNVFGRSAEGIEQQIAELIVSEFQLESELKQDFEKAVRTAISNRD